MTSKDFRKSILDKLSDILKPKGFKKSGNTFSSSNNELTYFIGVQSSKDTTSDRLKLTLNIEIYSPFVYKLEDTSLPEKWSRHFTQRIGFMLDNPHDKWWVISTPNEANDAANEIADITSNIVLPTLDKLKTTSDLAALWRRNICPGLTEHQRREYLALIDSAIK